LAEDIDDLAQRRLQRQGLALCLMKLGDHQEAAELFEQASEEATALGDVAGAAVALGDAGACLLNAGDAEGGRARTERALAMASGDDAWRAGQLSNLAHQLAAADEHELALQRLTEAANLREDPLDRAIALRTAAEFAAESPGLVRRAPELFTEELGLRREHEPSARWAWRAAEIGATLNDTAQAEAAREFFSIALRVFARAADRRQAFFVRNDRALAAAHLGDLTSAAVDLRAGLKLAEELDDRALLQQAHMNLGEIERRRFHGDSSGDHLAKALDLAVELEDLRREGETRALRALRFMDLGDDEAASNELAAVEHIAGRLEDRGLRASAIKGRAHLAFTAGRPGEAARLYGRAARLLDGDESVQLAECLGGQIVAAAWRGRVEEDALQRVADVSHRVGWDDRLLEDLGIALRALSERGDDEAVAELAAVMLAIGVRHWADSDDDDVDDPAALPVSMRPLGTVAVRVALWLAAAEGPSRRELLDTALAETADSDVVGVAQEMLTQAIAAMSERDAAPS
jgi:tetratricopeptide (TPR) repeat protein